jgi:pimeloyl-ACP methyl ester carboxylesterase
MSTVVLLHGQPGSAADWDPVVPLLTGLQVLVPSRPGYDGTPAGGFGVNSG